MENKAAQGGVLLVRRTFEIICASYRGIVTCQEVRSGEVRWTFDAEGLPCAINPRDGGLLFCNMAKGMIMRLKESAP